MLTLNKITRNIQGVNIFGICIKLNAQKKAGFLPAFFKLHTISVYFRSFVSLNFSRI